MNYQDWTEVKIGGGKINNDKNNKEHNENQNKNQNLPGTKLLKKLDEEEFISIEKVKLDDSKLIEKKRIQCKLSQKELAAKLNIPFINIKDLESGKGNNNKGLLGRINKFLDKTLKK